jgi:amino acid adenylation domain-containing protein
MGVGPEMRVGLHMERSAAMVVGLLGIAKAGGAYVPLDAEQPQERLAGMVEDAGAVVVVSDRAGSSQWERRGVPVISLEADWSGIAKEGEGNICSGVDGGNLAYVLYTSGTTGRPKGVCVEHRQLMNYVQGLLDRIGPAKPSFAMVQPLAVDSSVTSLFGSLSAGRCVYIVSREQALDSVHMAKLLQQPGVEGLKIAPSHLAALQSGGQEEVMPRGLLIIGGEASRAQWVRSLQERVPGCVIFNHYGPTETTVGVTTYRVESVPGEAGAVNTPLGKPLPNTQVYVLDEKMEPVSVGVTGELYIGGENVTRGYLNRADLTAEKFVPDPFQSQEGKRLYRTGDRARYLASGNVEFLGRLDDQVKLRGYRVELGEIEAALVSHAGVRQAVVMICGKEGTPRRLAAYVVPEAGKSVDIEQLRQYLGKKVPEYMVPSDFVEMEELPRTAHGKLDRNRLPEPERDAQGLSKYEGPVGEMETLLAGIWADMLKVERVGRQDNFFALGGHSLLAVTLIERIRAHGLPVSVRALFATPTVAGLAAAVGQQSNMIEVPPNRIPEIGERLEHASKEVELFI